MNILVLSAGFLTSVQDLGRPGYRQSGVSVGGALDSHAIRVANALVNNTDTAAGLEATLGSLRLRFEDRRVVAWCGGAFEVQIGSETLPAGHAGLISADEELVMTASKAGSRAWLAISGGIDLALVLGSRSTDLRGNFGGQQGRTLREGDMLPLGESTLSPGRMADIFGDRRIALWTAPSTWVATARGHPFLRILQGQHWLRFTSEAQASFRETSFAVTPDSDRMGVRFDGSALNQIDSIDLLSEAVAPGTVQVPPSGKPILLLGDCQTIGGYPRIAHVITVDLPVAAQLFPGDQIRFYETSLVEAQKLLREREEDFLRFRIGIGLRWQ